MNIEKVSQPLPIYSAQAVQFSAGYTADYIGQHALARNGLTAESAGMLAVSRLQWLLAQTRPQLSERFSEYEVTALLNCYQGEVFFPDMLNEMATAICEDHGLEIDEVDGSSLAELVKELRTLSPLERVTLADALEQAWYRAGENGKTHLEILKELGIEVK